MPSPTSDGFKKRQKEKSRRYLTAQSFEIGPGHKGKQKTEKLYKKGKSTDNPNEKEIFLKRTGPQLPLAKKKTKKKRYGWSITQSCGLVPQTERP